MSRVDQASRLIHADAQTVYAAMTEADALVAWLPPTGMSGEMLEFEPRAGGHYKMVLRYDDVSIEGKSGGAQDVVDVRYTELEPGALVSQAVDFVSDDPRFAGTMTMDWIIAEEAGQTLVTIRATNVPEGIGAEDHAEGLASSLENLAAFVERRLPAGPRSRWSGP
ncbi:Uncharacterized conserved protein YndB, AHSA1/START domain [Devosia lucknowensis]|uniref:Uncharacterized conserved protein YndB, AHSA1/START domain n=1 Tax=Devosia lucknowensis TaxID=1096929 RepID=A0A1Y6GC09_9HYPH|nr:SRPBCC domain-containing protein [Devosia lucknowensis]SMQ86017.1 Uncharacterized conserved protein YndB, AHSA1/START domain [Devosia lucknowensis]